jgi:RNA polymerase sigma-70 factor, ECF subfamily
VTTAPATDDLAGQRGRLFGLAYRLLGSVADAEDVVQDVSEVWTRTDRTTIDDPEAWLVTVTTRRCLDRLRSARRTRERYVGPWLPEPVVADPTVPPPRDPAAEVALADDVSFALLVVLDQLTPPERVAFVLHDVFGEPYGRIGEVVGRSPEATRQLASRARRRVHDAGALAAREDRRAGEELAAAFFEATSTGDLERLVSLLDPEVVLTSDGGGLAAAARRPVVGADRVARFFLGIAAKGGPDGRAELITVNGGPGASLWLGDHLVAVMGLDVADGRIRAIHAVVNPDKLHHLR